MYSKRTKLIMATLSKGEKSFQARDFGQRSRSLAGEISNHIDQVAVETISLQGASEHFNNNRINKKIIEPDGTGKLISSCEQLIDSDKICDRSPDHYDILAKKIVLENKDVVEVAAEIEVNEKQEEILSCIAETKNPRNEVVDLSFNSEHLLFDPDDKDDDIKDPDYLPEESDDQQVRFFNNSFLNEVVAENIHLDANENGIDKAVANEGVTEHNNENAQEMAMQIENEDEQLITPNTSNLKRARTLKQQIIRNKARHSILPPVCPCKVKRCITLFEERERRDIHESYWSMNKDLQKMWLYRQIMEIRAKRKNAGSRRNFSRTYIFPKLNANREEEQVSVCQKYFLSTLGYKSTTVVDHLLKKCKDEHGIKITTPPPDKRGRHVPVNKKQRTPIKEHIMLFNPRPSHYRREHAPNRKYLSTELTIKFMHSDYNEKHPQNMVGYELYRQVLDSLNIGFYELEADKGGTCIELDMKNDEESQLQKEEHLNEAKLRRTLYTEDSSIQNPSVKIYAADMQKVFLLPRMPKLKECFFTSRLIMFNETFASMRSGDSHYAVIWHEGIAGRRAEDVASAFLKFLDLCRDASDVILWLDNCSAQNKNWVFFSSLLIYINDELCTINSVTLKYLLTGHTYNAADGLHGKIEQAARKFQNIEDMDDYIKVVQGSAARFTPKIMNIDDFLKIVNIFKQRNPTRKKDDDDGEVPLLKNMVEVKFIKGETNFFFKTSFRSESYNEVKNILKRKTSLKRPPKLTTNRGINKEKKEKILKCLVPKMKPSRKLFWQNLQATDNAEDILEEEGF